jgi:hypothetical protein
MHPPRCTARRSTLGLLPGVVLSGLLLELEPDEPLLTKDLRVMARLDHVRIAWSLAAEYLLPDSAGQRALQMAQQTAYR